MPATAETGIPHRQKSHGLWKYLIPREDSQSEVLSCVIKSILSMFILTHLVYHKISLSSFVLFDGYTKDQVLFLYVNAPIKHTFCWINQASTWTIPVGKLSN